MPKEVRHILFTPEEVLQAMIEEVSQGAGAAQASADRFRLDMATSATGEVCARVVRSRRKGAAELAWEVANAALLTILLRLCRRQRIPLPMRGEKRLELVGTCLCLTVTLGGLPGPPDIVDGAVRYTDPAFAPLLARLR